MRTKISSGWRAVLAWTALIAFIAVGTGVAVLVGQREATPTEATFFVSPHPDDEFQMWSLVEQRPDDYKVFVTLTRGGGSGFCEPETLESALSTELGEAAPEPTPTGKETSECKEARLNSLVDYLESMGSTTEGVPTDFGEPTTFLLRADGEPKQIDAATSSDTPGEAGESEEDGVRVTVWTSLSSQGALVAFDLEDGNLSYRDVQSALSLLFTNKDALGVAEGIPVGAIVGAFANDDSTKCFAYPHPDHMVVHAVLWNNDFGYGPQLAATCFLDPNQSLTSVVSESAVRASFEVEVDGTRVGAHAVEYGWLHGDYYPVARFPRQNVLFQQTQSFWVRFS